VASPGPAAADLRRPALPEGAAPAPASAPGRLPDDYPAWAHDLAAAYFSGTTSTFVLHGNVHDLVHDPATDGGPGTYGSLADFLATRLFGTWDVVFHYDLGRGLRLIAGSDGARLRSMVEKTAVLGEPTSWPQTPDKVFAILDQFLRRAMLLEDDAGRRQPVSVAVILQHAQYVVPAGDVAMLATMHGGRLVRLLDWAQSPLLKRLNVAFCLVADRLGEVNARVVQSPWVETIEVPLPGTGERERFATWASKGQAFSSFSDLAPAELAAVSNGLTLADLNVVLGQARSGQRRLDLRRFGELKKDLIERQAHGLLEFYEPSHDLGMVVGHDAAKERLKADAALLQKGRLSFSPMGYLICGPVGTGKTFLAECYAGSIGIPCVKLRNFRSKYVGETEGNLEHVLTVLRSLGPVVVIIDEADAALGTREATGDSGTSARVFSMIASQMGDTRYRGQIVWMLLTSRPDRLPVDLKRQGRAEVHIPLFYPHEDAEFREMFRVMGKKNKVKVADDAFGHLKPGKRQLSGSDIESVVLGAGRRAVAAGREVATKEDVEAALGDFVPSAQGLEREAQELAAVIECSQLSFLPDEWRKRVAAPNGPAAIQERLVAIQQILDR
jgi:AAA+ superfamily predicted ATPase